MPYIVTTTKPTDPVFVGQIHMGTHTRDEWEATHVSRLAVATLEEAQQEAWGVVSGRPWLNDVSTYQAAADVAHSLAESGGTVGPLPDGTLIEVERVGYFDLADQTDVPKEPRSTSWGEIVMRPATVVTDAQILAAFNARQAT